MSANAFLTQFPVDPTDAATIPILDDMQGNILKGHGRQFTFNMFLSFKPGKKRAVRNWLADFSRIFVTTAKKQLDETQRYHDERIPGSIFVSVFLTGAGYKYLGVAPGRTPDNMQFKKGMKQSQSTLGDNISNWETGLNGSAGDVHAMILVADADVHHARSLMRAIRLAVAPEATVVAVERGVTLRNAKGDGIEHNNYVDGISQPVFFEADLPPTTTNWDPRANPGLMLVADPGGKFGEDSLGSYFVFRKLEQNVRGFKTREKEVAKTVFGLPADQSTWTDAQKAQAELIGAMTVGRFEDGTPVVLSDHESDPMPGQQENDFNYAAAGSESKCPFHAHIRKSGPRTDGFGTTNDPQSVETNKGRRLVRRGIPYEDAPRVRDADGELSDEPEDQPESGVGLLFMCYVADIANQFEFVQSAWVNSPIFSQPGAGPGPLTGKDPLIGQPADGSAPTLYHWPTQYGEPGRQDAPFGDFITMRGGEYFFAPCLSMLQSLKVTKAAAPGAKKLFPNLSIADANMKASNLDGLPQHFPDPTVPLNPVLQLFIPDQSDIGAGVVAVAANH